MASSGFDAAPTQLIDPEALERDATGAIVDSPANVVEAALKKAQASSPEGGSWKPSTMIAIPASKTGSGVKFGPSAESSEHAVQGLALPPPTEFIRAPAGDLLDDEQIRQEAQQVQNSFIFDGNWFREVWSRARAWYLSGR